MRTHIQEDVKTYEENVNTNEEVDSTEEWAEFIAETIKGTSKLVRSTKRRIYTRGFVTGVLTAVAVQSIITIWVMMN